MRRWNCVRRNGIKHDFIPLAVFLLVSVAAAHPGPIASTHKTSPIGKHTMSKKIENKPAAQTAGLPDIDPNATGPGTLRWIAASVKLGKKGNAEAAQGNWTQAQATYQQALSFWPDNDQAHYGLGRCAANAGDIAGAIQYYRTAIYTDDRNQSSDGWREGNVVPLMEYAILLSKTGQTQEALVVYHRAVNRLNYVDGKPHMEVLLPDFSPNSKGVSPQRLQALAHVAIGYEKVDFDNAQALSHLQQSMALAPDMPTPYFYWGRYLRNRDPAGAKSALEHAKRLGDAQVGVAADKIMQQSGIR